MHSILCLTLFTSLAYSNILTHQNDDRIIDGVPIEIKDVPHQVSLHQDEKSFKCGGTIINETVILTAAHCLNATNFIRAGSKNKFENGQIREVSNRIGHKKYEKYANDIGLLFLKEPLEMNENVSIAKLATSNYKVADGTFCTVVGWGSTYGSYSGDDSPILMQTQMPIHNQEKCRDILATTSKDVIKITEGHICAGDKNSTEYVCGGDSGGPLICDGVVVGIISFGNSYCDPWYTPSVFTRVSFYSKWIDENRQLN